MCPDKKHPDENKELSLLVYSPSVDCWAAGILAYELIVGHPTFENESRSNTYNLIMYKEPKFPPGFSAQAKSFILQALNKNPAYRPIVSDLIKHPWIQEHTLLPLHDAANQVQPSELAHRIVHARRLTSYQGLNMDYTNQTAMARSRLNTPQLRSPQQGRRCLSGIRCAQDRAVYDPQQQ